MATGKFPVPANYHIDDSYSVSVAATTLTTVKTFTLPAGTWLVLSYMNLTFSDTGVYAHMINSRTVRSSAEAGGGSVNYQVIDADPSADVLIRTHIPKAGTVRGAVTAIRLY